MCKEMKANYFKHLHIFEVAIPRRILLLFLVNSFYIYKQKIEAVRRLRKSFQFHECFIFR